MVYHCIGLHLCGCDVCISCGCDHIWQDTQIRVYNYNTTERVKTFEAHADYIRSLSVCGHWRYVKILDYFSCNVFHFCTDSSYAALHA